MTLLAFFVGGLVVGLVIRHRRKKARAATMAKLGDPRLYNVKLHDGPPEPPRG